MKPKQIYVGEIKYELKKTYHNGRERWILTSAENSIQGFKSQYEAFDFLHSMHGFCRECGKTFSLQEYKTGEYFDYACNKNLTNNRVCPYCDSWN